MCWRGSILKVCGRKFEYLDELARRTGELGRPGASCGQRLRGGAALIPGQPSKRFRQTQGDRAEARAPVMLPAEQVAAQ